MVAVLETDEAPPGGGSGEWLVAQRRRLDASEAQWLAVLGDFCAQGLYELDGQLSAVSWLSLYCGMSRTTAYERVKVAAELRRRPWLADALADGQASYSVIRLICRIDDRDEGIDRMLVGLAATATIAEVENAVRHWQLMHDQETPPPPDRWGYSSSKGFHGLGKATICAPNEVIDELDAMIAAFLPQKDPVTARTWMQRRLDGLLNMGRSALPHAHDGAATGADLYMVHVIADLDRLIGGDGRAVLRDGTPIDDATLAAIMCDCSTVAHLTRDGIEPLALGRKTREWSAAQRRAIMARDGGVCIIPGCDSTHVDIHHLRPWEAGGPTDTANGAPECRPHHVLTHRGDIVITGSADATLTITRRDGTLIGTHSPLGNPARLFE